MSVAPRRTFVSLDDLTLAVGALHLLLERLESGWSPEVDQLAVRAAARLHVAIEAAYD